MTTIYKKLTLGLLSLTMVSMSAAMAGPAYDFPNAAQTSVYEAIDKLQSQNVKFSADPSFTKVLTAAKAQSTVWGAMKHQDANAQASGSKTIYGKFSFEDPVTKRRTTQVFEVRFDVQPTVVAANAAEPADRYRVRIQMVGKRKNAKDLVATSSLTADEINDHLTKSKVGTSFEKLASSYKRMSNVNYALPNPTIDGRNGKADPTNGTDPDMQKSLLTAGSIAI